MKLRRYVSFAGQDSPRTGSLRNSYVRFSEKLYLLFTSGPPNSSRGVILASPTRWPFFARKAGTKSNTLKFHAPGGGFNSILVKPPENPPNSELSGVL